MGLSAAQKSTFYSIVGIPQNGVATIITSLSHIPPSIASSWEPTFTVGTLTNILTQLDSQLAAVTAEQQTLIETLLTRYAEIGPTSQMKLTSGANGEGGLIVDHVAERKAIMKELGNILGVWIPEAGFWGESQRLVGNYYKSRGLGDR